jgi:hypothetical protein
VVVVVVVVVAVVVVVDDAMVGRLSARRTRPRQLSRRRAGGAPREVLADSIRASL